MKNDIAGAKYVLLNITYSSKNEASMDEISDITDYIQDEAGSTADVIWGHGFDDSLEDKICVTIIATGFNVAPVTGFERAPERTVKTLVVENEAPKVETAPVAEVKNEEQEFIPFLKTTPIVDEVKPDHFAHTPVVQETPPAVELSSQELASLGETEKSDDSIEYNWEFASSVEEVVEPESFTFEIEEQEPIAQTEVKKFNLMDEELEEEQTDLFGSAEERLKRSKERLERIENYTSKLKKPEGLTELESVPAFKRRRVELDDVPHSSESQVSRFGLFAEQDGSVGLKGDNSFLHDNVD
jgi:cell division protein FtsZ